jgi:hypothetical protein
MIRRHGRNDEAERSGGPGARGDQHQTHRGGGNAGGEQHPHDHGEEKECPQRRDDRGHGVPPRAQIRTHDGGEDDQVGGEGEQQGIDRHGGVRTPTAMARQKSDSRDG